MDPSSPLQLIAWAVAAVLALLTAGCAPYQGGYSGFTDTPFIPMPTQYSAPPPYWNSPIVGAPRPATMTCFGGAGMVTCM